MVGTSRPIKLITSFVVVLPPVAVLRPPHDFVLLRQLVRFPDNAPPQFHQRCIQIVQVESARRAPRRNLKAIAGSTIARSPGVRSPNAAHFSFSGPLKTR